MKNGIKISISIVSLLSILFAFNQCVAQKKTINKKSTSGVTAPNTTGTDDITPDLPEGMVMPPMNNPTGPSANDEIDVGIKNFEQIYLSMATLTGVSPADGGLQTLYKSLSVQMPPDNNVQALLPAHQVAITKLASLYCEKLVENATLRAEVWPTINFAGNPPVVFTSTNKQMIIGQAITRFLPPLDTAGQTATSVELGKLFDELLAGEALTTSVTTRKVIKGMCIATLASAHATLL